MSETNLVIYGKELSSRLLIGSSGYKSLDIMQEVFHTVKPAMITTSIKRQTAANKQDAQAFWNFLNTLSIPILPNTAGCRTIQEVITIAEIAREIFQTDWIKLEIIGNDLTLQPDVTQLVPAAEFLLKRGFKVLPYCTEDLVLCSRLVDVGCEVVMPWAAPIGTGLGPVNEYALKNLRELLPEVKIIIDAGIGLASHVTQLMEWGFDGVLVNTAISKAIYPVKMAQAMALAVSSGRLSMSSEPMSPRETFSSSILLDRPFWHNQ